MTTYRSGTVDKALFVLIAFVALLTFPGDFVPITGGLDPSWMWGVNAFAAAGLPWGRDLIFSYGPLGYFARPLDVGDNVLYATAARLAVHCVIFGTVALVFWRRRQPVPVVLFLVAYPIAVAWNLEFDYTAAGAMALAACAALELGIGSLLVLSAIFAGGLLFVKFATGLAALLTVLIALALWYRRQGRAGAALSVLASYVLVVLAASWLLFGSIPGLLDFSRRSLQLSRGYNDAMSLVGPPGPLVAACFLLLLTPVMAALAGTAPGSADVFLVFAVLIPFSAKHAFLRADWQHMPFFFGLMWWAGATALLWSGGRRRIVSPLVLLTATVGLFAATAGPSVSAVYVARLGEIVSGRFATDRILRVINFRETRTTLEASRSLLRLREALPAEWTREIGRSTVMVLPWELSLCPANDLVCVPPPTLQMYATLTQELDHWAAGRLRAAPADFVIVEIKAIDGRNMIWDCPETWQALIEGWDVSQRAADRDRLLLRRRRQLRRLELTPMAGQQATVGEWIRVPQSDRTLAAAIAVDLSLFGRLRGMALRSREVWLHYKTASGEQGAARLVTDTARGGILIDARPVNTEQLAWWFEDGEVGDPIREFRIIGDGASDLRRTFAINWLRVAPETPARAGASAAPGATERRTGEPLMAVDLANGERFPTGGSRLVVKASTNGLVIVDGWAVDGESRTSAAAVSLIWDEGRLEIPAAYGSERPDVAAHFQQPAYRYSGFKGTVGLDELGAGAHRLRVLVTSGDRRSAVLSSSSFEVLVR